MALASSDPRRRNFAWVILSLVGGGHRCQTLFGEKIGMEPAAVSGYLSGRSAIPRRVLERVAAKTDWDVDELYNPRHPFAIGAGYDWLEPGDEGWSHWWHVFASAFPENPLESELRSKFPDYFPLTE